MRRESALINQLETTFNKTAAVPPKAFAAALAERDRVIALTGKLGVDATTLAAAIHAALKAGRDPLTDKEVTRAVITETMRQNNINSLVEDLAQGDALAAVVEHADEILAAYSKAFDAAAERIAAAVTVLGDVDLTDTATVVRQGGNAAEAWASANSAVTEINAIGQGWWVLAELLHVSPNPHRHALRLADVSHREWQEHGLERTKPGPWDLARRGIKLSLPTMDEYTARLSTIDSGTQRAEATAEGERQHEAGRMYRFTA